jgi:hypothetical protein
MSGRSLKRSTLPLLLLLLPAVGAAPARAQGASGDATPEGPQRLMARTFDNLYGDDYVQIMTLSTRRRGGQAMVRRIQVTRKQSVRPGKALVRFLSPTTIRNTGVLILENEGAYDDLWVFLPALDRSRRISGSQRADSFFGTDLTYEDIEPKRPEDWTARLAGTDQVAGVACQVLEVTPREGFVSIYDKMVSCVEPERAIALRTVFYRGGEPVKHLEVDPERVQEVAGRHIPFRMTLDTPRRRSETVVETQSYEIRGDLPERLFTVANLEQGDARADRRGSARD